MINIQFWHWLILGVLLVALEVIAPAMVLLWFGLGALLTGLLLWLFPDLGLGWQVLIFALSSVISVLAWRKWRPEKDIPSDTPELNNRLTMYIGKTYLLSEAIENGRGAARVGDSEWRVQGPDLPAGQKVLVTGLDGTILKVEPAP